MADPKVNIIITAEDKATSVLKGIGGILSGGLKVGLLGAAAGLAAVAGGVAVAVKSFPEMIGLASDFNETLTKTGQIFGEDVKGDLTDWANEWGAQLGQSKQQMLDSAATFGVFGKAAGLTGMDLGNFSMDLTELASDMASFSNTTPEEAIIALGAGLRGESEPLRRFGILLDDATLRQKALELGIISDIKNALTPQQRVLAANAAIWEQTGDIQGDFQRTSSGLANQQRILAAQITNVKTTLGSALLPVVNEFIKMITGFVSSEKFSGFLDKAVIALQGLAIWMGANLPIAIQFLSDIWTNTLQPAIAQVWSFLETYVIPFIQNVLVPWLQVNIPIALQILSDFWTNTLQPAIAAVWAWLSGTFIPWLQANVVPILQVVIPAAIQFLSDAWTKVLQPAIEAVWKFLTVDMLPVWEKIGELLGVAIPIVITALKGLWENVLLPALKSIWEFISTKIVPIFQNWSDKIGGISGAIQIVVDWIQKMIDKLKNLKLPDWLTPGSPTPFEIGLRGIADALNEVNKVSISPSFIPRQLAMNSNGNVNNFSMSIHTNAQSSTVMRDFNFMRQTAG